MAPAADAQGDQDDQDESAAFDIVAVSGFIEKETSIKVLKVEGVVVTVKPVEAAY